MSVILLLLVLIILSSPFELDRNTFWRSLEIARCYRPTVMARVHSSAANLYS